MNPSISIPSWKDRSQKQFVKVQIPAVPWRTFKLLMPHRMRRKLRSKLRSHISPTSSIASLQTSFSPKDTLRSLQSYRWTLYDFQYLLLMIVGIFSLSIIQSPDPLGKTAVATLLLTSLLLPITRQFFLPFLPIAAWLIFFYGCQYVIRSLSKKPFSSKRIVFEFLLLTAAPGSFPQNGVLASGFASCRLSRTFYTAPILATFCLLTRTSRWTYWLGFPTGCATTELRSCAL
jgi:hypothetical protein